MSTIGFDKLFYAKITLDEDDSEVYSPPVILAKAIKADLSVDLAEAVLYADDSAAEIVKEFKSGKLSLGINDIGRDIAKDLTGAVTDDNGVLLSASEDSSEPVAIGFRARKGDGRYRYFWLYRVKFGIPATNLQTKGDSISFQTPTIEGTVMRRNKPDGKGKHPWKAEVTEGDTGIAADTISKWFTQVYEPVYNSPPAPSPSIENPTTPEETVVYSPSEQGAPQVLQNVKGTKKTRAATAAATAADATGEVTTADTADTADSMV